MRSSGSRGESARHRPVLLGCCWVSCFGSSALHTGRESQYRAKNAPTGGTAASGWQADRSRLVQRTYRSSRRNCWPKHGRSYAIARSPVLHAPASPAVSADPPGSSAAVFCRLLKGRVRIRRIPVDPSVTIRVNTGLGAGAQKQGNHENDGPTERERHRFGPRTG